MTLTLLKLDTLLNVFLAIAVDNLANAQELSEAEAEAAEEVVKVSHSRSAFGHFFFAAQLRVTICQMIY